jgi:ribosomal protein S11
MDQGLKQAKVMVKGAGPGRETAIRGLMILDFKLL